MKKLFLLSLLFSAFLFSRAQRVGDLIGNDLSIELRFSPEQLRKSETLPANETPPSPVFTARSGVDPILALYFQSVLNDQHNTLGFKGLSAAVALPNGDVWTGASGLSSSTDSVQPDMLFGVGSVTKTFVAACILQLQEEGLLRLDDSLFYYLPARDFIDSTITLRQLLNHTSGIFNVTNHPDFLDSMNANLARIWTPDEVLDRFLASPYFPKGVSWEYSNSNYILLGQIIENVTGNSVGNEIRARFLTPLGISRTYYWPWEPLQGPTVHLWTDIGLGSLTDVTALGLPLHALWSAAGAAGAYHSTAENLAIWAQALYGGQVLEDSSLQQMLTVVPLLPGFGYGLGVIEAPISGRTCWGHAGDIIFGAQMYHSPMDTISIAVLTNDGTSTSDGIEPVVSALMDAYLNYKSQSTALDPGKSDLHATAFPNPFSRELHFSLETSGPVQLTVMDLNGRSLRSLKAQTGNDLTWDGNNAQGQPVAPGCYLYRLVAGEKVAVGKVVKGSW